MAQFCINIPQFQKETGIFRDTLYEEQNFEG
jgi:hypothetical protein